MNVPKYLRLFGWGAFVGAIGVCIALPLIEPDWVIVNRPNSILKPEGLFEQFQWPWYFLGALLVVWAGWKVDPEHRRFYLSALLPFLILGIRETDWDDDLFGERWYNIGRYWSGDVTWFGSIFLTLMFLGVVLWVAWIIIRNRKTIDRWHATHAWKPVYLMTALGISMCVLGMSFDKYKTIRKHFGVDISVNPRYKAYAEEVTELFGAILIFLASVEILSAAMRYAQGRNADSQDTPAEATVSTPVAKGDSTS